MTVPSTQTLLSPRVFDLFQQNISNISKEIKGCFKSASSLLKSFEYVSSILQSCFKYVLKKAVTWKFQMNVYGDYTCFQVVSRVFQKCLRDFCSEILVFHSLHLHEQKEGVFFFKEIHFFSSKISFQF